MWPVDVRLQHLAAETSGTLDDFRRPSSFGEEQGPGVWGVDNTDLPTRTVSSHTLYLLPSTTAASMV